MSILQRINGIGSLMGMSFSGNRDLYATFGYDRQITYQQMYNKFVRQDIAGRIVEAEPHATWANPPEIEADEAYTTQWNDLQQKFNIYGKFNRLDKLVGIGSFAILVLGVDDGQPLNTPLNSDSRHNLIYLQPYGEGATKIQEYERDSTNPRFGQPTLYRVNPNDVTQDHSTSVSQRLGLRTRAFDVHHSRVVHVAENTLEDESFGIPRLMRIYNLLEDLQKTAGGAAETFWLTSNRGMQVDVDKDMDLKVDDAEALSEEIDEYFHNLRRVIRTKGVKIANLGSDIADPRGTFAVLVALISGATGIPQRILLGSEAGQLASEQDRANWAVRIDERRKLFAEPTILTPTSRKLIDIGVLPQPTSLTYLWPDAFKQNPLERAQTSAQQARSLANVSKALSDAVPVVTPEEGRNIIGLKGTAPQFDDPNDVREVEVEGAGESNTATTPTDEEET